jgi:hypothetical protein
MKMDHYINKSEKLQKALNKYLSGLKGDLIHEYGKDKAAAIIENSKTAYPEIIHKIPFFDTPMYDSLVVLNSRMMALKKGMKDELLNVEDFVQFQVKILRSKMNSRPQLIRHLMGKVFLSKLMGIFLKKVARSTTKNGWPTQVGRGSKEDNYTMKVSTQNCQMVNFMRSVGEEDLVPYCSFADFANAESMGIGLKQTSTIDSGTCIFCFNKVGAVHWPDSLQNIIDKDSSTSSQKP